MIAKIPLTGKQLSTLRLRPDIYKKAGAQLDGKAIVGGETQLRAVRDGIVEWIESSGKVNLEIDMRPIVDLIDEEIGSGDKKKGRKGK